MRMHRIITAALLVLGASPAFAQDRNAPPHEQATEPHADKPITAIPLPAPAPDAAIGRLLGQLAGSFVSTPADGRPALLFRSATVSIDGFPGTNLVEITRADSPANPFRICFFHVYRRQGQPRLRVLELAGSPGLKDAIAGLWAAPDALPKIEAAALMPSLDLPLTIDAEGFRGGTTQPFPTNRDGAIEMTSSIAGDDRVIRIADA